MSSFPDADKICAQLIQKARITPPPTDLEAVSSLWKGLSVTEENLEKEGYLIYLGRQGAEMLLRKADPPNRRRFTYAHELGHWVLSNIRNGELSFDTMGDVQSNHATRHTPEEMWCNEFAGKLLMPTFKLQEYLCGTTEETVRKIGCGHRVFEVSEDAFLTRISDITGWMMVFVSQGRDLRRLGKQFIRRGEDRRLVSDLTAELLTQTCDVSRLPQLKVELSGYTAYGILKRVSRQISTYLFCIVKSESHT